MPARHIVRGRAAEQAAREWLEARGLECVATNVRCKWGEIDLVMLDGGCLAIIEVRYRARATFGGPLASVAAVKQQRIIRATRFFLQQHPQFAALPLRFDVVAMDGGRNGIRFEWQRRAFDSTAP